MRPKPVPIQIVCDTCGLDYKAHGESPSLLDCVRLLKERYDAHVCVQWSYTWPSTDTPAWPYNPPITSSSVEAGPICG